MNTFTASVQDSYPREQHFHGGHMECVRGPSSPMPRCELEKPHHETDMV